MLFYPEQGPACSASRSRKPSRTGCIGIRRKQVAYGPARWQERQRPAAVIISPAAGVFERGCGVDGPAGRAGARAGRWKRRSHLSPSAARGCLGLSAPARRAGARAGRGQAAQPSLRRTRAVVSASPLRPASPSVTRSRLGSSSPLRPVSLLQPRAFVSDPVLRSGRLCKHAQPTPPSAHARSSPDSGWPVCYPVRSPTTSPTHEAGDTSYCCFVCRSAMRSPISSVPLQSLSWLHSTNCGIPIVLRIH